MEIRKFKQSDLKETAKLISETFKKFNIKEGTKKGVRDYIEFYNPKKNINKIKKSFSKSPIFFISVNKNKIVGMIRGKKNRIGNLFVEGRYHNKKIGKRLLERFEKEAKKQGSKEIKVRASLYSTPFYQRAGYKKTTGIKNMKEIKVQPMIKKLK